jgi:hypothetical protein
MIPKQIVQVRSNYISISTSEISLLNNRLLFQIATAYYVAYAKNYFTEHASTHAMKVIYVV